MMTEPAYFADDEHARAERAPTEDGHRCKPVGFGGVFTSGYLPDHARLAGASELGGHVPDVGPSMEAFEWGHVDAPPAAPVDEVDEEVAHLADEPRRPTPDGNGDGETEREADADAAADAEAKARDELDVPQRTLPWIDPVNRWTMA